MASRENALPELVAERIRAARVEAGLTRTQAAAAMGISERTWADYERGIIGIGIDDLEMIANVTGQPPSFFIDQGLPSSISKRVAQLIDKLDEKDQAEVLGIVRLKLKSLPKANSRRQAEKKAG